MTETGGPGLGIDCAARAGIHVWEDHYIAEIVDPVTGAARPDGVEGELVVSTLTREGLPLVRYRTHDLTRVVARARCDCGRTALRVDRLRGRTDDMVIYKGVNFYPRQVETLLLGTPGLGHEYQIVLDSDGGGERMTVVVETEPGVRSGVAARIAPRAARPAEPEPGGPAVRGGHARARAGQVGARGRSPGAAVSDLAPLFAPRAASPCSGSRAIPPSSGTVCSRT